MTARAPFSRAVALAAGLILMWLAFDQHVGGRRVSRGLAANGRHRLRTMHRAHPVRAGETVFLGDSITFDGDWAAAFDPLRVRNRGIGWDTTDDLLERLDDSLDGPPATVVLMIGTNDLPLGIPHAKTVRNVSLVLDRIAEAAPEGPGGGPVGASPDRPLPPVGRPPQPGPDPGVRRSRPDLRRPHRPVRRIRRSPRPGVARRRRSPERRRAPGPRRQPRICAQATDAPNRPPMR